MIIRLTSSGSHATVLWTEPPDDASQYYKIGRNEWCGCDDKAHGSVAPHVSKMKKGEAIAILLTES